ncbi:hypothetical protein BTVI_85370 [Pitangus sulphuratus]|nr:hypothetical protein BTVI_85370 [Pitangus sulphuratus]
MSKPKMSSQEEILSDGRFSCVARDPRFWEMPEKERKVKIDKRFRAMFHDKKFKLRYTVDKRGRPVNFSSTENLRKFYALSESDSDLSESEEQAEEQKKQKKKKKKGTCDPSVKKKSQLEEETSASEDVESGEEEPEEDDGETGEEEEPGEDGETGEEDSDSEDDEESDSGPDLARGIGNVETSSEDDEDLNDLFPKEPEIEHSWRELDKDAPRGDEEEQYFLLRIYREKLREYQFKRLKYFYAVVECDSPETANKIYEECDGLEFESSCSFIDLRFIPDNITFDDKPKDEASEVNVAAYKPKYFTSAAMGTSKVDITWDETDHERVTSLSRTFNKEELLDMDFQAYLASSSEEEEEEQQDGEVVNEMEDDRPRKSQKDDEEQIAKYRELLQSIQEKEKKQEEKDIGMEIKWVPDLGEERREKSGLAVRLLWDKECYQEEKLRDSDIQIVIWKLKKKRQAGLSIKGPLFFHDDLCFQPFPCGGELEGLRRSNDWKLRNLRKDGIQSGTSGEVPVGFLSSKTGMRGRRVGCGQATAEREESEDELPPDVDLSDPYFAEELEKTGPKKKPESVESTSEDEDEVEKQKAEMALLMMDDEDDTRKHFNYKKIVEQQNLSKKKKKLLMKRKELLEDDFQVNVADTRFQAMFTSPLFNLDPSDPNFKKTKAVEKILEEKARRREEKEQDLQEANKGQEKKMAKKGEVAKKAIDPALSMLIKSVKNKTEEFQARKKQKFK